MSVKHVLMHKECKYPKVGTSLANVTKKVPYFINV